jgi:hypothetical protein
MSIRIQCARALAIASGLTILLAATMPGVASAQGAKKLDGAIKFHDVMVHRAATRSSSRAASEVGQDLGATLIFGSGDVADAGPPLNINPDEPLTNLAGMLSTAGYPVDVLESPTLPKSLKQYRAIWYVSTEPLSLTAQSALETFVRFGGAVYLTGGGAGPCCGDLNSADQTVIDSLVSGGGVQVGDQGYADTGNAPEAVNASAIDDVALTPNVLSTWTPSAPGGMSGVSSPDELTSTTFSEQSAPTGAAWDRSSMVGGQGRLAILMDITWLESEFWDQSTAAQMAINLESFLMSAIPVPAVANKDWAGFAAKAQGVRDVNSEWTVPTVNCSRDSKASAVRIWVGIDGLGNSYLANAGVAVTCASPTANPCYFLFLQLQPSNEFPVTGCGGVIPGDDVYVDITSQPFGSSNVVITMKVNGTTVDGQSFTLTEPNTRDASAECVVELPSGLVGSPALSHYKKLAEFTPVSFTDCDATATENAGIALDSEQLTTGSDGAFSVNRLNMGKNTNLIATTTAPAYPNSTWSVSWLKA